MKPKKVTVEGELEERKKTFCDEVIHRAGKLMIEDAGVSMGMMIDRVICFAAAHACTIEGSPKTAAMFREVADKIDAGLFHSITGEDGDGKARH